MHLSTQAPNNSKLYSLAPEACSSIAVIVTSSFQDHAERNAITNFKSVIAPWIYELTLVQVAVSPP